MTVALRVASFNIRNSRGTDGGNRWLLRRRACLAAIRGFGADVVGLQEVRPGQVRHLQRRFPDTTVLGAGRDAGGGGEHASVLVAPTGWQVESSETRWLSDTPDRPGSKGWDAASTRVVTLVRLRNGDTRVGVANTHLDDKGTTSRRESAALIASWLTAEPDRPWVVLGDLNAPPGSPPLRLFADAGWTDSLPPDAGGTEHAFTGRRDRQRIDFVLTGPGVVSTRARIDYTRPHGRLPSDHWAVVADLVVSGPVS